MGVFAPVARLGLSLAALVALAACEPPKWEAPKDGRKPAGAGGVQSGRQSADPAPAAPAWAAELIGKPLRPLFPGDGECIGNTDNVDTRYAGTPAGTRINGWGWDQAAKKPVARVLLVDEAFKIVGVGETGVERVDVPVARPDVTSPATGWTGVTGLSKGSVYAYGVLADGKSVCRLGHLDF